MTFGGLDMCSCKRGFFTLRDCTNMATGDVHELLAPDLRAASRAAGLLRRVRRAPGRGPRARRAARPRRQPDRLRQPLPHALVPHVRATRRSSGARRTPTGPTTTTAGTTRARAATTTTMTTAAGSATPDHVLWLTETYPPSRGGHGAVVRPDRARAAPARRDRRRAALHAGSARAAVGDRAPGGRALPRVPDRGRSRARAEPRVEHVDRRGRSRSRTSSRSAARGRSSPRPVFAAWLGVPLITLLRGNDFDAAVFSIRRRPTLDDALARSALVCANTQDKVDKIAALHPGVRTRRIPNGIEADWAFTAVRSRARARVEAGQAGDRALRPAEGQEGRRVPARRAGAQRGQGPRAPAARGLDGAGDGGVAGLARRRRHAAAVPGSLRAAALVRGV